MAWIKLLVLLILLQLTSASILKKLFHGHQRLTAGGHHWALIIAGSQGWVNYRHQADVCHAYHVLREGGISEDRIITMMADDIAHDEENPTPGQIINRPGGPNVYAGVKIDYSGADVTAKNFLAVLAGDRSAMNGTGSGRVLATGPNDLIFVYYSDHGGSLALGMPSGPFLEAADLIKVLKVKAEQKGFERMTLYIEACESGSMFDGLLPNNIAIYATTAADPTESSWATYCPPQSPVGTCLGDLYSVAWMENEDVADLHETLQTQYKLVKLRTSNNNTYEQGSHVMQYGSLDIANGAVGEFMGSMGESADEHKLKAPHLKEPAKSAPCPSPTHSVKQQDADLVYYFYKYLNAQGEDRFTALRRLNDELRLRIWLEDTMNEVVTSLVGPDKTANTLLKSSGRRLQVNTLQCFSQSMAAWDQHCGGMPQYGLSFTKVFTNLCHEGILAEEVGKALQTVCRRVLKLRPAV